MDPSTNGKISPKDGTVLAHEYRDLGINLAPADKAVEAGIFACHQRLAAGRLKIFRTCRRLLSEIRIYRRDEHGKVVKEMDDMLDAMRRSKGQRAASCCSRWRPLLNSRLG